MDKRSRHKGKKSLDGASKTTAHKERQIQRRDRTLEFVDNAITPLKDYNHTTSDDEGIIERRTFFVGDRVFFLDRRSDGMDPTTYRGTIMKVYKDPITRITFVFYQSVPKTCLLVNTPLPMI